MASKFDLSGRVALVTGSTRGIGWRVAEVLAQSGASVVLNGVASAGLLDEKVAQLSQEYGVECHGFYGDVSDPSLVKTCYSEILSKFKRLDILVNNAGILDDNVLGMITADSLERTLAVNAKSVIYNMQYASRLMGRNKSGSIINISSIIGLTGNVGQVAYASSKAAVIGATKSAAKELAPLNIRVNAIAPGFIETDMTKSLAKDVFAERVESIAMGRVGTTDDVASAVLFFASDLSTYCTGQVLGVDGGMVI